MLLEDAVETYRLEVGELPNSLDDLLVPRSDLASPKKWQGPYLDKLQLPTDPWNSPYQYERMAGRGKKVRIWSKGPDRVSGTPDDIVR